MPTIWGKGNDLNDLTHTGMGMTFTTHYPVGRGAQPPSRDKDNNGYAYPLNPALSNAPVDPQSWRKYDLLWYRPWLNDPTRAIWDEDTQLWYAWVITNGNEDFPSGTWGEIVSPDLMNWVANGYRFYTDNNDMGTDLWGGSAVVDHNNTAGFGAGAVIYTITMPGHIPESPDQCTTRWVAPRLGCAPVFDAIVQPNFGQTDDPDNPVRAPGVDFRDSRVDWDEDNNQWVNKLTVGYGIAFYGSSNTQDWKPLSVIDLSPWQQIETPDLIKMTATDGTEKWVLAFSVKTWNGQSVENVAYMVGSWDGKKFTPDQSTPTLFCEGPDFYAQALFQRKSTPDSLAHSGNPIETYGWGWMMNWNYAGNGASQGYCNTLTTPLVLTLELNPNTSQYELRFDTIREQFRQYPSNAAFDSGGHITGGGTWVLTTRNSTSSVWSPPTTFVGSTYRYDLYVHLVRPDKPWPEFFIDMGVWGDNYTRLTLNPSAGTYTFSRANSGSDFFGKYMPAMEEAFMADTHGTLEWAAIMHVIILWDGNGVEIIINNQRYISANIFLPDVPRGLRVINNGKNSIELRECSMRY